MRGQHAAEPAPQRERATAAARARVSRWGDAHWRAAAARAARHAALAPALGAAAPAPLARRRTRRRARRRATGLKRAIHKPEGTNMDPSGSRADRSRGDPSRGASGSGHLACLQRLRAGRIASSSTAAKRAERRPVRWSRRRPLCRVDICPIHTCSMPEASRAVQSGHWQRRASDDASPATV